MFNPGATVIFSLFIPFALICKDIFVKKSTYPPVDSGNFFSKSQTDWLRGIAIIMIMYSHYYECLGLGEALHPVVYQLLSGFGMYGVALFLLMSGYATMISKQRKPNYLKGYIPKRLLRLYVPFLIVFAIIVVIRLAFGYGMTLKHLLYMPLLSLPETLNWYLKVQLGLYIVFYLLSKLFKSDKKVIVSCFCICFAYMVIGYITNIAAHWYESSWMFPLGVLIACYKEKIFDFLNKRYIISLIASIFLAGICYIPYYLYGGALAEILFIFGVTQFVFCLCVKVRGTSIALKFLGKCSLELYLAHEIYLLYISALFPKENLLSYFVFILLSVLIAVLVHGLSDRLLKTIYKKNVQTKHD